MKDATKVTFLLQKFDPFLQTWTISTKTAYLSVNQSDDVGQRAQHKLFKR